MFHAPEAILHGDELAERHFAVNRLAGRSFVNKLVIVISHRVRRVELLA